MIIGCWFHDEDAGLCGSQVERAWGHGVVSVRSYEFRHVEKIVSVLRSRDMCVLAGVPIDVEDVLTDPLSVSAVSELEKYLASGVNIRAVCIGNELRDPWTEVGKWTLSPKLAANLAVVLRENRRLFRERGIELPVTYSMEGPFPWSDALEPVVEACDLVCINLFSLEHRHWFGPNSLAENKKLLTDARERRLSFLKCEVRLREVLQKLSTRGKQLFLSETGLPSGVSYEWVGDKIVPEHDVGSWEEAYCEYLTMIAEVSRDYEGVIAGVYLYEWRDNYFHNKRMLENSPIHTCFGLCHGDGAPKIDVKRLLACLCGIAERRSEVAPSRSER